LLQSLHTVPSTPSAQYVDPVGAAPQVPSFAPAAMLQTPLQQSTAFEHASPDWMQNDDARTHAPLRQSCEQHSALPPHELPAVLQAALSA
jgi:hypothetical protein